MHALEQEVVPCPVHQYEKAIAETNQLDEMNTQPPHSRHEARECQPPDMRDGGVAPDRSHHAAVAVVDREWWLPGLMALNVSGRGRALLGGDGRDHRQGCPLFLRVRQVADHIHAGKPRHLKHGLDRNAAAAIRGQSPGGSGRLTAHAGSPDGGFRSDRSAVLQVHFSGLHPVHDGLQAHFHTHVLKPVECVAAQARRQREQQTLRAFDEQYARVVKIELREVALERPAQEFRQSAGRIRRR